MSDNKIRKLTNKAQKAGYLSHTDRWRKDSTYRKNCESHTPPTPEFLIFLSGEIARADGTEGHIGLRHGR